MASEYLVSVVPDTTGFTDRLREALEDALADVRLGVTTEEVETFEYNGDGSVSKHCRTTTVRGNV